MFVQAGELHSCGRSQYVAVTKGPDSNGAYEGRCAGCGSIVFGTVYPEIPIRYEEHAPISTNG